MKFSAPVADFQKVLAAVGSIIPARTTIPTLENFLFELSGNRLRITATDLDTSMTMEIDVKGSRDGKITVPAKRLSETVRALTASGLTFIADTTTKKISLNTENGEYKLTGLSAEDYPSLPDVEKGTEFNLDDAVLRRIINSTVFAAGADELRPAMTGVFLKVGESEVSAVSTDGHRLAKFVNSNVDAGKAKFEMIIPARAMQAIARSLHETASAISCDNKHAVFSFNGTTITSRLIDEKYPNYQSVIPTDNNKELVVNRAELLATIRRTSLYASSSTHQIRLAIGKNSLVVSAEDADLGSEAKETVPCKYASDSMEIGFNAAYMVDVLSHLDDDEVSVMLSSPTKAVIIKPSSQRKGENLMMLIMPVRLSV